MKKRICFFLIISLGALSIAPIFNAIAILNDSKPAPNVSVRRTHLPNSSIKGDGVRVFLSGRDHPYRQ
ncbi:hypothetical protein, partial [Pseudomonas soli]|uniref:hypothetical protein n=1 Tax=Pseudomonas soli TaxID=1306993 RepID=UPI003CFDC736